MPRPKSSDPDVLPPINTSSGKSASGGPPIPPINTSSSKSASGGPPIPPINTSSGKSASGMPPIPPINTSSGKSGVSPLILSSRRKIREKPNTNATATARNRPSKKQLIHSLYSIPPELRRHISSYVPEIPYKQVSVDYTGTSDMRFNYIPIYARDLAFKLMNNQYSYEEIINTLYRWYVYADQDWNKFIKDYPKNSDCANIFSEEERQTLEKYSPKKCYIMFTEHDEWQHAMYVAKYRNDPKYITFSSDDSQNDIFKPEIKKIMINEQIYMNEKEPIFIEGGKRNTSPKSRNTSPKSRNTSPKTTPERSIEKTDTNNTKNTRLTKKERFKKNINKIPLELISHISSYVPNITYKHVGKKTETREYKDKYYRFNLIPPYAINLALKLSDILGYDTPHVNTKLIYDKIANTLYRWYVYADQDWDKFIKDYPKEGECVNILYIDNKEEIMKEYPNKCYHIFTEDHEWTQAIAFASLADRTARYIDKSILNDIEEIMVNEPLYIHDKRLNKKGGQRNTRKNRGV